MTVKELIEKLKEFPEDKAVMIYDRENVCVFSIQKIELNNKEWNGDGPKIEAVVIY